MCVGQPTIVASIIKLSVVLFLPHKTTLKLSHLPHCFHQVVIDPLTDHGISLVLRMTQHEIPGKSRVRTDRPRGPPSYEIKVALEALAKGSVVGQELFDEGNESRVAVPSVDYVVQCELGHLGFCFGIKDVGPEKEI